MTEKERQEVVETDGEETDVTPVLVDPKVAKLVLDLAYWGLGSVKENEEADSNMFSEHERALNAFSKLVKVNQ